MKILLTGSKEYPLGSNGGDDPIPSGGIERYVDEFAEELAKNKNFSVSLLTRKFRGTSSHETVNGVETYRLPWVRGWLFRNVPYNFLSFMKTLALDYDVLHAHCAFATLFGVISARLKGKRIVATPHGLAFGQPQYSWVLKKALRAVESWSYSHADSVVFLSEQEKKEFSRKLGFLPRKSAVIHTGVNKERFRNKKEKAAEFRRELGSDAEGKKIVSFVGRIIGVKGVRYLLEAVPLMKSRKFLLVIVGGGPEESEMRRLAEALRISDRVKFTGFYDDVSRALAATDVFVLPSVSEGLPIVLLEAMASGCAVIASDIGLPIRNRENGVLVTPKDPEAIAKAVDLLLGDEKLRAGIAENGRRKAEKEFSWPSAAKEHAKIYRELA